MPAVGQVKEPPVIVTQKSPETAFLGRCRGWIPVLMAVVIVLMATHGAEASGPSHEIDAIRGELSPAPAASAVTPSRQVQVPATTTRPAYWAFVPTGDSSPRTILLALHGMGQVGDSLGGQLMPFAQERNWVIIAPTIEYGEWRDPERLALAEARVLPQVMDVVDDARRELGVATRERILVFGFSRGAHAAARLGLLYPNQVVAVAAASGSAYTLPTDTARNGAGRPITAPFPLGTGNIGKYFGKVVEPAAIARVQYWVGVGANDDRDADAPRAWDLALGKNRLERAARFANAMEQVGCVTRIFVSAGAGHELLPPAMDDGVRFLAAAVTIDSLREPKLGPIRSVASVANSKVSALTATTGQDLPPDSFTPPTAMLPLRSGAMVVPGSVVPKAVWSRLVARYTAQ